MVGRQQGPGEADSEKHNMGEQSRMSQGSSSERHGSSEHQSSQGSSGVRQSSSSEIQGSSSESQGSSRVHFFLPSSQDDGRCLFLCLSAACARAVDFQSLEVTHPLVDLLLRPLGEEPLGEEPVLFDLQEGEGRELFEEHLPAAFSAPLVPSLQDLLVAWIDWLGTASVFRVEEGFFIPAERPLSCRISSRFFHPILKLQGSRQKPSYQEWVDAHLRPVWEEGEKELLLGPTERGNLGALLGCGQQPSVQVEEGGDEWQPQVCVSGLRRGRVTSFLHRHVSGALPGKALMGMLWTLVEENPEADPPFPPPKLLLPDGQTLHRHALLLRDGQGVLVQKGTRLRHVTTSLAESYWDIPAPDPGPEWTAFLCSQVRAVLWVFQ